jgi:hypothetical protein
MAGHEILDLVMEVRILPSQPYSAMRDCLDEVAREEYPSVP